MLDWDGQVFTHTVGQLPVTVANTPEFINLKEDEVIQGHHFEASFPISGSLRLILW